MIILRRAEVVVGVQWILMVSFLFISSTHCNDTATEHGRVRRSYTNRTTDGTKKGCAPCATCGAPCAAVTPAPTTDSFCTDNPCYFPSLPYACSADQCQEFINTTTSANGVVLPAKIVNLPPTLCVTSCQVYNPSSSELGFTIHRFGVCSRDIDLSPKRLKKSGSENVAEEDNVESKLDCDDDCFDAEDDAIGISDDCSNTIKYTQDTVVQCILRLKDSDNDLVAIAAFDIQVIYVPPSECGTAIPPPGAVF